MIEVSAHFDTEGQITPLNFIWRGRTYKVESTGRRWQAKDGLHVLVMAMGNQVFHLIFSPNEVVWRLLRGGEVPTIPVVKLGSPSGNFLNLIA
jgi:hypothetical protein